MSFYLIGNAIQDEMYVHVQQHQYMKWKTGIIFKKFAVIFTCLIQQENKIKTTNPSVMSCNVKTKYLKLKKKIDYAQRIPHKEKSIVFFIYRLSN